MCNDDPDVFPVSGGPHGGVVLSLALLCPGLGSVEGSNTCVGLAQWEPMTGGMGCLGWRVWGKGLNLVPRLHLHGTLGHGIVQGRGSPESGMRVGCWPPPWPD